MNAQQLKSDLEKELERILAYWSEFALDSEHGGFVGGLNNANEAIPDATKGAILNARILWTFSSASRVTGKGEYLKIAERAYHFVMNNFVDAEMGGVFWELSSTGEVVNDRKQIYAIAFTIYGLSEYYRVCQKAEALEMAISLYKKIEEHSFDPEKNGYLEAFTREWGELDDVRLSDKDENALKTMNTHLHVLEAYTCLYRIWKNEELRTALRNLIEVHIDQILQPNYHFGLFFDESWNLSSGNQSFGHDIEGSWLIYEAAEVLGDADLIERTKDVAVKMAEVTEAEGLSADFAVMEELHVSTGEQDPTRHWWPQAEGIVGFFNAYEISGNDRFLKLACEIWEFTKNNILDMTNGEWFWRVDEEGQPVLSEPKAGFWKCPYHNSRACMEIIERVK